MIDPVLELALVLITALLGASAARVVWAGVKGVVRKRREQLDAVVDDE